MIYYIWVCDDVEEEVDELDNEVGVSESQVKSNQFVVLDRLLSQKFLGRHFLHLTQAKTTSLSVAELESWPQPGHALDMMTNPAIRNV